MSKTFDAIDARVAEWLREQHVTRATWPARAARACSRRGRSRFDSLERAFSRE